MAKRQVNLKRLLAGMTLDEKIGQLMQLNADFFINTDAEATGPVGNIGINAESLPLVGSALNFNGVNEMKAIQDKHLAADPNKIPMIFMMDVIHGYRTIIPIPLAQGCCFDPALVEQATRMTSREAASGGINVTFTPMVDYIRDARWGRVMESFGEDVVLNCALATAEVRGFRGDGLSDRESLATCAKHFVGYGAVEAGRDYNLTELSEHALRQFYLPSFKACIDAGVDMIMPSYNPLNGIPPICNPFIMKQVLKKEWKFRGVVISDYNAIGELIRHGVAENKKDAARLAFDCGCTIEMMSTAYHNHLKELVEEGVFTEKQIDDEVMKVLKLKKALGLFDDPYRGASEELEAAVCLTPENRAIARRMAEECAVLLKNEGVLPFSLDTKKIALIGPFADLNEIKGFWSCCGKDEECVTVAEGVRALLPDAEIKIVPVTTPTINGTAENGFGEALAAAEWADAVVLCLGEHQKYSGEGNSRTDIRLPDIQNELAAAVCKANEKCAVLLFNGRPLELTAIDAVAPAILDMWFPGSEGGNAAANLLFGVANPSGKLSTSFPKSTGQCPITYTRISTGRPKRKPEGVHEAYTSNYIDCGNLPLFFFGQGLSYTSFEYENMSLSTKEMERDEKLVVEITVRNTGGRVGKEVVQLYMRDRFSSTVRPVQELLAFKKIELAPGEAEIVRFEIDESMLALVRADGSVGSESGEFDLMVGYADHFVLRDRFELK